VTHALPLVLLLGACAAAGDPPAAPGESLPGPNPDAQDRAPGRRTLGAGGVWEAVVAEGGGLSARRAGRFGDEVAIDVDVDHRVALAADGTLLYARRGELVETDLWRVRLPDGAPERVTAWVGSEDRPVLSRDGRRLAFVSGRTGMASWWVLDLSGKLPVAEDAATQLTNVGLKRGRPGRAPVGFVPPPDGTVYAWTDAGLEWVAEGRAYTVVVP